MPYSLVKLVFSVTASKLGDSDSTVLTIDWNPSSTLKHTTLTVGWRYNCFCCYIIFICCYLWKVEQRHYVRCSTLAIYLLIYWLFVILVIFQRSILTIRTLQIGCKGTKFFLFTITFCLYTMIRYWYLMIYFIYYILIWSGRFSFFDRDKKKKEDVFYRQTNE